MKAKGKTSTDSRIPTTCASVPFTKKRRPPAAMLFMAIIASTVTVGSGLNCMAPAQKPPNTESTNRLRRSAWNGVFDRRDTWKATCGQTKPLKTSSDHTQVGTCSGYMAASTQKNPTPRPTALGR
ncbi:hypothetical protein D9M71_600990 [compost metagenome]